MNGAGEDSQQQVTRLLVDWKLGDQHALELLTPIIYDELRKLARWHLNRERNAQTLQPTVLVHEAYLRLVTQDKPDFESRGHFFGLAAHLMRQVLADYFRKKKSLKRGGGISPLSLDEGLTVSVDRPHDIIALDDAMTALAAFDERKCRVIELRFFGGFSVEETAAALSISIATVGREQRLAEAWLGKELLRASE